MWQKDPGRNKEEVSFDRQNKAFPSVFWLVVPRSHHASSSLSTHDGPSAPASCTWHPCTAAGMSAGVRLLRLSHGLLEPRVPTLPIRRFAWEGRPHGHSPLAQMRAGPPRTIEAEIFAKSSTRPLSCLLALFLCRHVEMVLHWPACSESCEMADSPQPCDEPLSFAQSYTYVFPSLYLSLDFKLLVISVPVRASLLRLGCSERSQHSLHPRGTTIRFCFRARQRWASYSCREQKKDPRTPKS